ncbi:3'(2'),5'-bisphosphate nucleotidase CysQ [Thiohalomonas denitrificans]|uniref:3'(2'),5'-bisphosphate nucleotidase CysQ n=1 Tax=Thiohalomonas denitrificans TaxID=415747 RepID=A0A1G5R221_9GAMM|nr:3'(2'),5'-bisphosphate nucleotidase CysQ [Thiohalomonas denitrificans]SCZ67501.1 3'(2'),5'-bisphosphate nucleotidase [Thiohalomonas denitrificans]
MVSHRDHHRIDPCELLTPALEVAIDAGRRILEIYEAGFKIEQKEDETPLTEADTAASDIIEKGLSELTPELPVLTEESVKIPYSVRRRWSRYWLVDPLDGTREFIQRTGEFTVNIALIHDQEPVLGIVYAPAMGVYYYACRGQGAYKRNDCCNPERIRTRRLEPGRPVVVAGSRSHRGDAMEAFLKQLREYEFVPLGSALKSCLVAEGTADIYARLGPTSEWDTAATQCIVEEAGGLITDTRMRPLRYNTKEDLLNPHFFTFGDREVDWSRYLGAQLRP